jgi:hypothetical protein
MNMYGRGHDGQAHSKVVEMVFNKGRTSNCRSEEAVAAIRS